MKRGKKWVDPRKELKKLAQCAVKAYPLAVLGHATLRFLKNEAVTLVISEDEQGVTCTAHPSPAAARREMISYMLDVEDDVWAEDDPLRFEFLEAVSRKHFKLAIDLWNTQAAEDGSDGHYQSTHDGKVEKNYTVAELKDRADAILADAKKKGLHA